MSTPTPWSGTIPVTFTGSYLKRQVGVGNLYVGAYSAASGGGTVFDALVNPPATGTEAETDALERAEDVGVALLTWVTTNHRPYATAQTAQSDGATFNTPLIIANMVKKNFDFVMNFYLENSIARDTNAVPII